MNINALRKNYARLTPKERFAVCVAAENREDDQEHDALMQSAPKKTFAIKHHYGLWIAFERLAMFHHARQLANAGLLLMLLVSGENTPGQAEPCQAICKTAERYKTGAAAWAALCKEYGIDPQAPTKDLPGDSVLNWANRFADLLQDDQDLSELQKYLDDFRQSIEKMAGDWA